MLLTVPLKRKLCSDYMPDAALHWAANTSALEGLSLDRQAIFLNAALSVTEECGLEAGEASDLTGQRLLGARQPPQKGLLVWRH